MTVSKKKYRRRYCKCKKVKISINEDLCESCSLQRYYPYFTRQLDAIDEPRPVEDVT